MADGKRDVGASPSNGTEGPPPSEPEEGYDPAVPSPDFAPAEPTDGREVGDWRSRYTDKIARRRIRAEAAYVLVSFVVCGGLILVIALDSPRDALGLTPAQWATLSPFALAVIGGALGGTLFSTKWLYHSVARGIWNADRWLWRFFTPFLAAGAAFTVVVLSAGKIIPLFGSELVRTKAGALGVSLLVGYFSDRTFSRLERLAEQQLGSSSGQRSEENGKN
jgi:hypothetical protein